MCINTMYEQLYSFYGDSASMLDQNNNMISISSSQKGSESHASLLLIASKLCIIMFLKSSLKLVIVHIGVTNTDTIASPTCTVVIVNS